MTRWRFPLAAALSGAVVAAALAGGQPAARWHAVDGDTIERSTARVRILNIDAPEIHGRCDQERRQALLARNRLQEILHSGQVEFARQGRDKDRYGRDLRLVFVDGVDVGEQLIGEGLARRWNGKRRPWCSGAAQR